MQKRKNNNKSLSLIRTVVSCTIFVISIAALVSVHLHIFLYSKIPIFSDPSTSYKLPKQHEIGGHIHGSELSWTQELTPPQFSKLPPPSQKLNVAAVNRNRDIDKLWKAPQNKDFVPCVEPSPEYSLPTESRGYLLVHTNGGLNQMRAGICDVVAVACITNATLVVPELDKRSFWQDTRLLGETDSFSATSSPC